MATTTDGAVRPGERGLTVALLLGVLLASLEMAIVNAVLPQIATDLHDAGLLPWVFAGYIAAATVATPLFGVLADRVGRRAAYAWGMGLLLAGSLVAALAPSMPVLLLGRVLQGLSGGAVMPVTIVILGDRYPVAKRAAMFGTVSIVWGGSTLIGPLLGSALTGWWGWRALFWINLAPGVLALWGVWRQLGGERPPGQGAAWTLAGLFSSRAQIVLNLAGSLAVAALYGLLSHVAAWVQGVEHGSSMQAGLALLPLSLAWTAGTHVASSLVGRMGLAWLIRAGNGVLWLGAVWAWWHTLHPLGLGLFGLGMGVLISCYNLGIQELAPAERKGVATSVGIFLRNLAATVMVPVYGWVAGFRPGIPNLAEVPHLAEGIRAVVGIGAGVVTVAALVAWLGLPRRLDLEHG